jgi:UDP-GlcNAc:undecaprenyl-phosphate GlcNAc-1-phosphate transferase
MLPNYTYLYYLAIFLIAAAISTFSIPSIIYSSLKYHLFDDSDLYRKNHKRNISRLGGLAIFSSFTISVLLFSALINFKEANYLIVACLILCALGLKDDVYGTRASTKFLLQFGVAFILVVFGNIHLTSLYGVLGIGEINIWFGGAFSVALIIFLNNAFNLIDGIDGYASSIGAVVSLFFGILFAFMGQVPYAFIALALCGSLIGFLKFNWYPAKIFMGDTGALTIGLITAVLAIKFIELNKFKLGSTPYFYSAPAKAVAILIIPIFDSLRVFTIRILQGKSPFLGDRNHIHHRLLLLGFKPNQIVFIVLLFNIIIVAFTLIFSTLGNFILMLLIFGICIICNYIITLKLKNAKASK